MGIGPAIFESAGQRSEHYIPGSYSRSASVNSGSGGVSAGNAVILGKSNGGKPQTLLEFGSLAEAKAVLAAGELLEGVAHAFTPSPDYAPQRVFAMRVNPGTQASRSLKSGVESLIKVKSWDWGVHCNQVKMWVSSGTKAGTKKIRIAYKGDELSYDDIGLKSFALEYTGSGTNPTATITKSAFTIAVEGGASGDSLSIPFDEAETIEELVSRINDNPSFVATLLDMKPNAKTGDLDTVSGISLATAVVFTSNLYALVETLMRCPYVGSVEYLDSTTRSVPDNDTAYMYFEGGTTGAYTVSEWASAIQALSMENVQILATPSTDEAVHILIANHCAEMSNTQNRKERTFILGGPIGESIDDALAAAKKFGTRLGSYCFPHIIAANPLTGETETLAASLFACKLAGMESSLAVNEPLTWKTVSVLSFGKKLDNGSLEKCIRGGVLAGGITDDNRLAVIRAMTTYQGSNLQDAERSMVREDLYMNRDLRTRYSGGIGRADSGGTASDLKTFEMAVRDWVSLGLIQMNDNGQYYWGLSVRKEGDKTYITFNRNLTPPRNFVFIAANNFVYSSSSAAVSV